jgi:hypothetical protein
MEAVLFDRQMAVMKNVTPFITVLKQEQKTFGTNSWDSQDNE